MRNWVTMIRIFEFSDYGEEMGLALQHRVPRKDIQATNTSRPMGSPERPSHGLHLCLLVPLVPLPPAVDT